jgi:hypothetical protein
MAFNKDELKEITRLLQEQGKMQDHLNESMRNYTEHLKKIAEMQKNIKHISEQVNRLKGEENDLTKDLDKLLKIRNKGTQQEINARRGEIKLLIDKIKAKRISVDLSEKELDTLREINNQYVEQARNVNKVNLGLKEGAKFLKEVPNLIQKGYGKFKSFGLFDMEKAARMAAHEMGIVSKNSNGFRQNIYNAAETTLSMGVGVKDLAKMQGQYSAELGRTVQLSEQGMNALAEMAAGTTLGVEGAAAFAAEMEKFNISAIDARDMVQETVNMSQKMGINSNKVLKSLQENLKMANKYHFKGGVAGMAKMAATAEKFRITMDATSGMADQLFNIEGAVEMSAQLNTMGGEWSKLGDPMKLMFQARNDMEGLQESVIQATSGMADFNKETGEFEFSGLELHRMKELEKITGISAENMAEMAKQKAKFAKVRGEMGGTGISDDMMQFVEANAQFNKKNGKFEVKLEGGKEAIPVDKLTKASEGIISQTQKSLKERAEATQTFDDTLQNTIDMFKVAMLPILEGINEQMPAIRDMIKSLKDNGWIEKLKGFAQTVGNLAGSILGVMLDYPKTFSAILLASPLLNVAKWFMNGITLGKGFLSVAGGMGGGGGLGGGGSMGGMGGGLTGGRGTAGRRGIINTFGNGRMGKGVQGMGKMLGGGKMLKGIGVGMLAEGAAMGIDYGRGQLDNPDSGFGQSLGVAGGALSGAATGAMIGSIIPGIGTAIGAVVGGIVGGVSSAIDEFSDKSAGNKGINDGILADGKVTPIDSKDKVFEISKPGGAYDKAANSSKNNNNTSSGPSSVKIHISFDELKVSAGSGVGSIDLESDSAFMRELATKVKEALSKTANGGVLSPNPS